MSSSSSGVQVFGITASLDGVAAIQAVVAELPVDFPAAILIVQHKVSRYIGPLDRLVSHAAGLDVRTPMDGEYPSAGTIYVAPLDRQLTLAADGCIELSVPARVSGTRPSADRLFLSLAPHARRARAVVLSGRGEDGAEGCRAVRRSGGLVLVQDPVECKASSMPRAVLARGGADLVLPAASLGRALVALSMTGALGPGLFGLPSLKIRA